MESNNHKRVGYAAEMGAIENASRVWEAGCRNQPVGVENKDDTKFKQGGDVTKIGEWDKSGMT